MITDAEREALIQKAMTEQRLDRQYAAWYVAAELGEPFGDNLTLDSDR